MAESEKSFIFRKTPIWFDILLFFIGTAVGILLQYLLYASKIHLLFGSYPLVAVFGLLALFILYRGFRVRQYKAGKLPELSPFFAASTLGLAKAALYAGYFLAGLYFGTFLFYIKDALSSFSWESYLPTILSSLLALILGISGSIVEHWCSIDPPEDSSVDSFPIDRVKGAV